MIGEPPIFAICDADTGCQAVLGGPDGLRLYPFGHVPQDNPPEPRPYAVWRRLYGNPENTLSCPPDMDYVGIEVACFGDPDTCGLAHDAIILAIQQHCHVVGLDDTGRDPNTDDYWVSFTADWFVPRAAATDSSDSSDTSSPPVPIASLSLTMGQTSDALMDGYTAYDEATGGWPGAPIGALSPDAVASSTIMYLIWSASGGGFQVELWATEGGLAAPTDLFDSVEIVDDDATVWTFTNAGANTPGGTDFSFGAGDVRGWAWTVDPSPMPAFTIGNVYAFTVY